MLVPPGLGRVGMGDDGRGGRRGGEASGLNADQVDDRPVQMFHCIGGYVIVADRMLSYMAGRNVGSRHW